MQHEAVSGKVLLRKFIDSIVLILRDTPLNEHLHNHITARYVAVR